MSESAAITAPAETLDAAIESLAPARRRDLRLKRNRIYSLGTRVAISLFGMISASLMIRSLGVDLYGIWVVLSTIPSWLTLMEFGTGPILRNRIAAAEGQGRIGGAQQDVSAYFAVFLAAALAMIALGASALPWVDVARALNLGPAFSAQQVGQIALAAGALVVTSLLAVPLGVGAHIAYGLQRTYLVDVAALIAAAIGCLGLLALIWVPSAAGFLPAVTLVGIVPHLCTAGLLVLVCRLVPALRPSRLASWASASWIFSRASAWFSAQHLASIVAPLGESFIVLQLLSPADVSQVGLLQRWFLPLVVVNVAMLQPLHPAFAESMSRGDHGWAGHTLRRFSRRAVTWVALGGLVLWLFQAPYLRIIGHGLVPNDPVLGLAILARILLQTWAGPTGMFLFAAGRMAPMVLYSWIGVALYIPLALLLGRQVGSVGVVAAAALSYLPVPVSNWWESRRILRDR